MSDVRYSREHEWVRVEGGEGVVGISAHAQEQLGDIVFVELPDVGRKMSRGDEAAVVESVKAASEVYAPVDGEVIAINEVLTDEPGKVNEDAEGNGWFFRIKLTDPSQLEGMMDAAAYKAFVEENG